MWKGNIIWCKTSALQVTFMEILMAILSSVILELFHMAILISPPTPPYHICLMMIRRSPPMTIWAMSLVPYRTRIPMMLGSRRTRIPMMMLDAPLEMYNIRMITKVSQDEDGCAVSGIGRAGNCTASGKGEEEQGGDRCFVKVTTTAVYCANI
ncbi:hypothetical protein FH972_012774 [Carpinus fangiana]|uniref:Uncharacterized protein n=1 Tax=Carpinus fangiana TaxID=176857 RepID=A0A5N6R5R9_9ROSI|nr:hypothetical protein FH972_012774 [Carpinus fangiana]